VQIMLANGTTAEANVANPLGLQAFRDPRQPPHPHADRQGRAGLSHPADIRRRLTSRPAESQLHPDLTSRGITLETIRGDLAMPRPREAPLQGNHGHQSGRGHLHQGEPAQVHDPELTDLLWIVVRTPDKKKQIDRELLGGQSFESVADRLSEVPNTGNNRIKFPQNRVELFPADLRAMVDKTGETGTTGWLLFGENRDRWAKFYVMKKTPSRAVPIDEDMREAVRREIAMERGSEANDLQRRIQEKLKAPTSRSTSSG
jgi:hypothetical protein